MIALMKSASVEGGAERRALLALTAALWAFCFATYFASTFLWTDWAPPAWLLLFNTGATVTGFLLSLGLAAVLTRLRGRSGRGRLIGGAAAVIAIGVLQTLADQQIWRELFSAFAQPGVRPDSPLAVLRDFGAAVTTPLGATRLVTYLWLFGLYATLVELLFKNAAGRRRERQLVEAQEMVQRAQLAALRFQVNPHFLFNTLNGVSSLIVLGRGREAEAMMMNLSDFLRTTLEADPHEPVSLADELHVLERYLEIEEVRFGERLEVEMDCPPDLLDAAVPSLILQPLAENAVKHGVARGDGGGRIVISAERRGDDLEVVVQNAAATGNPAPKAAGTGVGLANIRNRLKGLYGLRGRLEAGHQPGGYVARVTLPLSFVGRAGTAPQPAG
jgi:two-component sensor histidine kinase